MTSIVTLQRPVFLKNLKTGSEKAEDYIVCNQIKLNSKESLYEVSTDDYGPLHLPFHNVSGVQLKTDIDNKESGNEG